MRIGRAWPGSPELERDAASRASLPRAEPAGEASPERHVLRLQRLAGNRAVGLAMQRAPVQRQPQPSTAAPGGPPPGPSAELAAILAQIEQSMAMTRRVAPYEVISSTTAAQFSTGELDTGIERLWRRERLDFMAAARRATSEARRGDAVGTASARLQPDREYALRRTVNLFAANYRRGAGSDLSQVAAIARRGSPYRRALEAEFGEQASIQDPTAAEMEQALFDAILRMWTDLQPGEVGELVVTFSGHGAGGRIYGVDGESIGIDRLDGMATFASDHNVHLIYVLDTCRAGSAVDWAQAANLWDIEQRIAELPKDRQDPFVRRLLLLKRLANASMDVADQAYLLATQARASQRRPTTDNRVAYTERMLALTRVATAMREVLTVPAAASLPGIETLLERQQALGWSALAGTAGRADEVRPVLHDAALLLDGTNDTLNDALPRLDSDTRDALGPEGRPTPAPSPAE